MPNRVVRRKRKSKQNKPQTKSRRKIKGGIDPNWKKKVPREAEARQAEARQALEGENLQRRVAALRDELGVRERYYPEHLPGDSSNTETSRPSSGGRIKKTRSRKHRKSKRKSKHYKKKHTRRRVNKKLKRNSRTRRR